MAQIESITKGPSGRRESNFELLRMLAMFFVLVVHADFAALKVPTSADLAAAPAATAAKIFFEMTAIVSVNLFILISGWFGIRASLKGFCKFLFQVLFYAVVIYLFFAAIGIAPFTPGEALSSCFEGVSLLWFVAAYMLLYIMAPMLNAYVEKATKRQLGTFLAAFFTFETVLSFILESDQFNGGYSVLSFMGLYLLAQWMRRYGSEWNTPRVGWLLVLVPLAVDTVADYFVIKSGISGITTRLTSYSSPLVIAQSLGFLILFANIRSFSSRAVNWMSSGCFAVYLIHCNKWVFIHFKEAVNAIYASLDGPTAILGIGGFLLGVFFASVLVDKLVREPIWRVVEKSISLRLKQP